MKNKNSQQDLEEIKIPIDINKNGELIITTCFTNKNDKSNKDIKHVLKKVMGILESNIQKKEII